MRIFIGIKLDQCAVDHVEKFLEPFKKIGSPLRWTKPGNIHITVKFIGDVTPEKCTQIEKTLIASTADFSPSEFPITLAGCGKFGRGTELDIFWIGIAPPYTPLTQLVEKIETNLSKIGIKKEDRPFTPHITVGRNKKMFNFKPVFQLIDEHKDQPISGLTVRSVQLFESRLTPDGPIYKLIKEIPLGQS